LKRHLSGKWQALRQSPELQETVDALLARPETIKPGLELISVAEKTDATGRVARMAADKGQTPERRAAAIQTLGSLPGTEAVKALEDLLRTAPADLRTDVVQALGRQTQARSSGDAGKAALRALENLVVANGQDISLRKEAAMALTESERGSLALLDLHRRGGLPDALKPDLSRLLRNSPYRAVKDRAVAAFPAPGRLDPKKLPAPALLATRKGNAARGKQLLASSITGDLQCLKCHTIRGVGGNVGPDLSVIGKKASRENLFESILFPSKAIADQYVSWTIETRSGSLVTGLLVEETPDYITLRDANAKDTKINKKEIESRAKSLTSLMPDNLLVYMTEDDLVDIVEYLFTLKTPSLTLDAWHIAGPFDNGVNDAGLDQIFPPEKGIDLGAVYQGKSGPVKWRTVKPNGQGYVDLMAFLAGDSNVVSYLYREIESAADQEAEVLAGTNACAKLWINDALVYTNREHRAAAPAQDHFPIKLKKGKNKLLLKITNDNGAHGFYLTILADQELKPK